MIRSIYGASLFFCILMAIGCTEKKTSLQKLVVKNNLAMERSLETVEIDLNGLFSTSETTPEASQTYGIVDSESKTELISQTVDSNGDGKADVLLFQPTIEGNSEKVFEIILKEKEPSTDSIPNCYSRFVPERTDDYAWENNRVAFRTYGPTAQKMIEDSIPGGTLSSGIDAWLKRVDYPIINRWYQKELETDGTYHEDTGEGLDNFHVGTSRGVGGIAAKVDTAYHISKNFIKWKTITTGPIRTSFVLDYADWDAQEKTISERKHISLDYGSNLSRFKIEISGIDTVAVGLTLHEKNGITSIDKAQGWASYWEPHGDSELGQGVVVKNASLLGFDKYETDAKDLSNLFTHLNSSEGKITYYAGFGWKKSGQFTTKEDWNAYLADFAQKINNPLEVTKL